MPRQNAVKITNALLAGLKAGAEVHDSEIRGLSARRSPGGTVSFSVRYRVAGHHRRSTVGVWPTITMDEARRGARQILSRVALGEDPSQEKREAREEMTVSGLYAQWMENHVHVHCKPKTIKHYQSRFDRFARKTLGRMKLSEVRKTDLVQLHLRVGREAGHTTANHLLGQISSMYGWARGIDLIEVNNPTEGIVRFQERPRRRYLKAEERTRVMKCIHQIEEHGGRYGRGARIPLATLDAIRCLLLTGARKEEIAGLRWEEVDLERRRLFLGETKEDESTRPLTQEAVDLLQRRYDARDPSIPWVFPSSKGNRCSNIHRTWDRIRASLGLEDVVIHVFRHSFASDALRAGLSYAEIALFLGHKYVQTTMRYAHLMSEETIDEAAAAVDARIKEASNQDLGANVVFFPAPQFRLKAQKAKAK